MDFPTIHTNFWDAVIAVPSVMIITQMIKMFLKVAEKVHTNDSTYHRINLFGVYKSQRVLHCGHIYGMVLWLCSNWKLCLIKDDFNRLSKQ